MVRWGSTSSNPDNLLTIHLDLFEWLVSSVCGASLQTRSLVRTISFPSNISLDESWFDADVQDQWLSHALQSLPLLQSVSVPGRAGLINGALSCLQATHSTGNQRLCEHASNYRLRLLNVSHCGSIGSGQLLKTLRLLPRLTFLDLSYSDIIFAALRTACESSALPELSVLKLKGIGLQDWQLSALARALGTRVWSLDLSGNQLTDVCVDELLDYCFCSPDYDHSDHSNPSANPQTGPLHTSPWDKKWDEERWVANQLAHAHDHVESLQTEKGVECLYLSGNNLTATGFERLLQTGRLRALDCGTILLPNDDRPKPSNLSRADFCEVFGAASLIPVLQSPRVRLHLYWLRINHQYVTGASTLRKLKPELWDLGPNQTIGRPLFRPAHHLPPYSLLENFPGVVHLILTDTPRVDSSGEVSAALMFFFYLCAMYEGCVAEQDWRSRHGSAPKPSSGYPIPEKAKYLRCLEIQTSRSEAPHSTMDGAFTGNKDDVHMASLDDDVANFHDQVGADFSFFPDENTMTRMETEMEGMSIEPDRTQGGQMDASMENSVTEPDSLWREPQMDLRPDVRTVVEAIRASVAGRTGADPIVLKQLEQLRRDAPWPGALGGTLSERGIFGWARFREAIGIS